MNYCISLFTVLVFSLSVGVVTPAFALQIEDNQDQKEDSLISGELIKAASEEQLLGENDKNHSLPEEKVINRNKEKKTVKIKDDLTTSEEKKVEKKRMSFFDKIKKDETVSDFYNNYIKGKLQIGTRSVYRLLTKDDSGHKGEGFGSGTYLGTIYGLDEKQNLVPSNFYARYLFNKYFGFELAYDKISAETVAFDSYRFVVKTDGDINLSGFAVNLYFCYPNFSKFIPYFAVGVGSYSADFDARNEWTYSPIFDNRAYNQMDLSSVTGFSFGVGTEWVFAERWRLDLSVQYLSVDVDGVYTGYFDDELYTTQPGHFPMDNISFRLGIAFQF